MFGGDVTTPFRQIFFQTVHVASNQQTQDFYEKCMTKFFENLSGNRRVWNLFPKPPNEPHKDAAHKVCCRDISLTVYGFETSSSINGLREKFSLSSRHISYRLRFWNLFRHPKVLTFVYSRDISLTVYGFETLLNRLLWSRCHRLVATYLIPFTVLKLPTVSSTLPPQVVYQVATYLLPFTVSEKKKSLLHCGKWFSVFAHGGFILPTTLWN